MEYERMADLEQLMPRILPQVLPCPKSIALDALQTVAMDFCKETGVWDATFQETACPCETVISPAIPKGAGLASVKAVYLDGEKLEGSAFEVSGRDIILREAPAAEAMAVIQATLRPLRTATQLPEDILEEYGDCLAFGTIARLKAMSGQSIEWTDQAGMNIHYQLYREQCGKARARKLRKRLGATMLYVNTEDV